MHHRSSSSFDSPTLLLTSICHIYFHLSIWCICTVYYVVCVAAIIAAIIACIFQYHGIGTTSILLESSVSHSTILLLLMLVVVVVAPSMSISISSSVD